MVLRVLSFVQDGCMACSEQAPINRSVSQALNIPIEEIDVMKERSYIRQYRLSVTPTIVVLKKGTEVARFEGVVHNEALEESLRKYL
ncbi:MAG: thioredoxin family protein [Methanoregulaceae archaeon]|nr:thioredoxin family protein [Methanoregulaceae archaeon]